MCKPGVSWIDVHFAGLRKLLEGLRSVGFVKCGDFEEQMNFAIPSIFQPHGLGHLMGLDYHDVGGYNSSIIKNKDDIRVKYLRCGRIL